MDIRYKVYLDNILLETLPEGLDELVLAIIRESGLNNTEQVLRDNAESQLSFTGDGFAYICIKRRENYCQQIKCVIQVVCSTGTYVLFEGLIKQSKVEIHHNGCIAKCNNLKDNSFSGILRDVIDVDVALYNTKTKGCQPLSIPVTLINTPTTPSTYTITDVVTFDALDVLKYIIAFHTDNAVTVKSDYLESIKIAITMVYNLHNTSGNLNKVYPTVSFEKVFTELRKKETLYKIICYEPDGTPYISIEPENDSYSEDPADLLFVIDEMPEGAIETLDEKKLFNSINVGSSEVKLADDANIVVPQERLTGWNKENYIGCGGCTGEKDTTLEIVSDFVIDGNIVHEAMLQAEGADYTHDSKIMMLHYFDDGGVFKLVGNNTSIYNERFNNENTLNRWVGVSNSCIAVNRFTKYGFKAINNPVPIITIDGSGNIVAPVNCDFIRILGSYVGTLVSRMACFDELYDNENTHSLAVDLNQTAGFFDTRSLSQFICQENGNYIFHAKSKLKCIQDIAKNYAFPTDINYAVRYVVYADNTYASIIDSSPVVTINNASPNTQIDSFDFDSPTFALVAGNVVMVEIEVTSITVFGTGFYHLTAIYDSKFTLISDNTSCQNIEDSAGNFKPFLTEFDYDVNFGQYLAAKNKKKGYVLLKGQKVWIDKLSYKDRKVSTLSLVHKNTFGKC